MNEDCELCRQTTLMIDIKLSNMCCSYCGHVMPILMVNTKKINLINISDSPYRRSSYLSELLNQLREIKYEIPQYVIDYVISEIKIQKIKKNRISKAVIQKILVKGGYHLYYQLTDRIREKID